MRELSSQLGYEILHVSNDEITPVTEMEYEDNQKVVVFDDYVYDKNQRQLIDYFTGAPNGSVPHNICSTEKILLAGN